MAIQDSHPLDQGDFPQPSSVEMSLYPIMSLLQSQGCLIPILPSYL